MYFTLQLEQKHYMLLNQNPQICNLVLGMVYRYPIINGTADQGLNLFLNTISLYNPVTS